MGAAAYWFGTIYQDTISGPGGAAGFAAIAQPTADAMRPLTGPADRLDTYGGYFTYHNLGYIAIFLAVYAAIQGARAVRGDEERGLADLFLAAGRPRWTLVRDRFLAFAVVLTIITLLSATGVAFSAAAAGEPAWSASYLAVAELALTALVAYSLAMLVSQLLRSSRGAATLSSFALVVLYFLNNVAYTNGVLQVVRWISPFAYTEQSRPLIPGQGVSIAATAALVAIALGLAGGAALAYQVRDSGAPLLGRLAATRPARPPRIRLRRLANRDLWLLALREQWIGLTGWVLLAGVLEWLYVALGKQVIEAWGNNPLVRNLFFRMSPAPLVDQYISFTVILTAGIAVAFVIVQAARWLGDIDHGRAEMAMAHSVSRTRLVLERALSLLTGVALIAGAGIAGLLVGAWSSSLDVNATGALRTFGATVLLAIGVGGASLLVVAWLRSGIAVAVLTLVLAASWLITLFGGIANLPDWLMRISVFDAFGNPYTTPLRTGSVIYLAVAAVLGCAVAAVVTSRRSAVAP